MNIGCPTMNIKIHQWIQDSTMNPRFINESKIHQWIQDSSMNSRSINEFIDGFPVLWRPVLWRPVLWDPVLWNLGSKVARLLTVVIEHASSFWPNPLLLSMFISGVGTTSITWRTFTEPCNFKGRFYWIFFAKLFLRQKKYIARGIQLAGRPRGFLGTC